MRCKICDRKLFESEATAKDRNGEYEDTCNICKVSSFDEGNYFERDDYICSKVESGLTQVKTSRYQLNVNILSNNFTELDYNVKI